MALTFTLAAHEEFRLEVSHEKTAIVKVVSGSAEMSGVELVVDCVYSFSGSKLWVFTFFGCVLECSGADVAYVGKETSVPRWLRICSGTDGRRVLVVGPQDAGKSSLCRTLCNWKAKLCVSNKGDPALLVDVDPNHAMVPGTITAEVVARPMAPAENHQPPHNATPPLAFYYGDMSPLVNIRLYNRLLQTLADHLNTRLHQQANASQTDEKAPNTTQLGTMIIDTPYQFSEPAGFELLEHAIQCFKVDVIVVIGHERLYSDLSQRYSNSMTILKLFKAGGVSFD
jgi:polyribonucleotide 5'-hydroxyl-kinase